MSTEDCEKNIEENNNSNPPLKLKLKPKRPKVNSRKAFLCAVCPKSYVKISGLRYHVRKDHFNMKAKVTEAELRDVNAVWVERVQNSDALIEITKTGPNTYLMKKATYTDGVEIHECTDTIDMSMLYPTCSGIIPISCNICNKTYNKRDFKRHINERHQNIKRQQCNFCSKAFKRTYQYLKHICNKKQIEEPSYTTENKDSVENNMKSIPIED